MKKFILISIFPIYASFSFSQQNILTYNEAVRIAVEQNITIKQQQNNLQLTQANKKQSVGNFLPSINAYARGNSTNGRQWSNEESAMVNSSIDRAKLSIDADMTVFNGFKNIHQLNQSNQLKIAQEHRVEQSVQEVIFQVSEQYLQLLLNKEMLAIANEDLKMQRKLLDQLKIKVKFGTRTETELLTQKAQLKTSEVNYISIKNQLRQDKAQLAKTLFFKADKYFDVVAPKWILDSIIAVNYNVDSIISIAIKNRPDAQSLSALKKASLSEIKITKGGYMPQLNIFYKYGSNYASNNRRSDPDSDIPHRISFNDQLFEENISHYYGVNLKIPIFNKFQNNTKLVQSKVSYENSMLDYTDFELQLNIDIRSAFQNMNAYKESYIANVTRAEASQKSYLKQMELYRLGEGSLVELNLENQRNNIAQFEKVKSEYDLIYQQIVIKYLTGNLTIN